VARARRRHAGGSGGVPRGLPGGGGGGGGDAAQPYEAAGARGEPRRVVYCAGDGTCQAAWRQQVMVPAAYTSTKAPREMHVYVSASDGVVIAQHDRLRTFRAAGTAAPPGPAAVAPPSLLPPSAYVKARSSTPEARGAAERINAILARKYDGPSMIASQGIGQTLYSGQVPLDTAQVTRLTNKGARPSDVYVLTDLKRLGLKTYDLRGRVDEGRDGGAMGEVVNSRKNQW
jgi:hypothetical protein